MSKWLQHRSVPGRGAGQPRYWKCYIVQVIERGRVGGYSYDFHFRSTHGFKPKNYGESKKGASINNLLQNKSRLYCNKSYNFLLVTVLSLSGGTGFTILYESSFWKIREDISETIEIFREFYKIS